jgi:hypothetical protein
MRFSSCQQFYLWLTTCLFMAAAVIAWNVVSWHWSLALNIPVSWALAFGAGYCLSRVVRAREVLARQGCSVLSCLSRKRLSQDAGAN